MRPFAIVLLLAGTVIGCAHGRDTTPSQTEITSAPMGQPAPLAPSTRPIDCEPRYDYDSEGNATEIGCVDDRGFHEYPSQR